MVHAPRNYNRTDQALLVWQQPGYRIKRRMDIIITPYHQYYPTILAWTGSKHFEQSLRLYAKKKKLKIVHHGVFSRVTGDLIPINSEKQVFDLLGLDYLEPEKRDF
jgi:DNA polymerase/3'-5' exonuclease PolX